MGILIRFASLILFGSLYAQTLPSSTCYEEAPVVWTGDVSVLAWQAREEGLEFALNNNVALSNTPVSGNLVGIDFAWEPAFKVEFGVELPSRAWDFNFQWTQFLTETERTIHGNLLPLWAFPSSDIATQFLYESAKALWNLHLNEFDITLGYHPLLSPKLALRFHAGVKVATVNQFFQPLYTHGFNDGMHQLLDAKTTIHNRSVGAGPRLGFDSKWRLSQGVSLLASVAGSLPLWHYRITREDEALGSIAGNSNSIDSFFWQRFWIFRPILETALGFGWDRCFGREKQYAFGIEANYELQYFPEQNMMAMLVNPGVINQVFEPRGDLHVHGATITFHFGY